MPQNNHAPLKTPAPAPVFNPDSMSTHMDIQPLDPRQGQPIDDTVPHATDTVLPDVRPTVQQPMISPLSQPDPTVKPVLPTVAPKEYSSGSSGVTKT
jgi:hypothetical protein